MGTYDATAKYLIEHHAADWLALAGVAVDGPVRVVDTDLSTVTSVPDKLVRVGSGRRGRLVNVEFQSGPDARLDERVLGYNVLARRRHRRPVHSVVFLLRPAADSPRVRGSVRWAGGSPLSFAYQVVRAWELPPERLLAGGLGTLPMAVIGDVTRAGLPGVIRRIRDRLDREVPPAEAGELWTATGILLGLRYDQAVVDTLLKGVRQMRESSFYQGILDAGRVEGRVDGERELLVRLGTAKLGRPSAVMLARLRAVADAAALERLGVALLTATSWAGWLGGPTPAAGRRPRNRG